MSRALFQAGLALVACAYLASCAGGQQFSSGKPWHDGPLGQGCAANETRDGARCRALGAQRDALKKGGAALKAYEVDKALQQLARARKQGPYAYEDHVRLYEQLGIAWAYADKKEKAIEAFEMLLMLAPGHAISYTLSPKATFLFARARERAKARERTALRVSWPRDLFTHRAMPLEIEVVADPRGLLARARLFYRAEGSASLRHIDVPLPKKGAYRRLRLPALGDTAQRDRVLSLHAVGFDARGNEVLRWADARHPRHLTISYRPPTPWYKKWWVWVLAGSVAAAATGASVYAATRAPPDAIDATFSATSAASSRGP